MELATFTEHMLLNWWLLLLVGWKALSVGYFRKKKNRLPPMGDFRGLPEQSLGLRGNGWGANCHIGGWLVDSPGDFFSPRARRPAARAPSARAPRFCGPPLLP